MFFWGVVLVALLGKVVVASGRTKPTPDEPFLRNAQRQPSPIWHDPVNHVSDQSASNTKKWNKKNHRQLILAVPPTITKSKSADCLKQAGRTITPDLPEELTISLNVQGAGSLTQLTVPVHVVFSIDSSSSMRRTDPNGLRIEAALQFVDRLSADRNDLAGVIAWDRNIDINLPLTNDFQSVRNSLNQIDSCCGTNLDVGLEAAKSAMGAFDANVLQVIVFLTDGQGRYTRCDEVGPANQAANLGFVIFSIALSEEAYDLPLVDMALCTGGTFSDAKTAAELVQVFDTIFEVIEENSIPFNIDIKEVVESHVTVVDAPGATVTELPDGKKQILWSNIDSGAGFGESSPAKQFSYTVRVGKSGPGVNITTEDSDVTYTDSTGAIPNSAGTSAVSADVTGDPLARCKASTKNVDCSAVPPEACFVGSDVDDGSTDYSCLAGDPPDLELVALIPNLTLCFGVGSHTVTLEVVNQDGLTSDCTAPVTVSNVANCGPTTPPISAPPTEAPVTPAPVATTSSPTNYCAGFLGTFKVDTGLLQCGRCPS